MNNKKRMQSLVVPRRNKSVTALYVSFKVVCTAKSVPTILKKVKQLTTLYHLYEEEEEYHDTPKQF